MVEISIWMMVIGVLVVAMANFYRDPASDLYGVRKPQREPRRQHILLVIMYIGITLMVAGTLMLFIAIVIESLPAEALDYRYEVLPPRDYYGDFISEPKELP